MIQLAVDDERLNVLAADKVRIDPNINGDPQERKQFIISAIKQMLANGSFQGRNVISFLPSDKLRMTSLRLADAESEKIEQILRKEVERRFGLNPEEDMVDYHLAGSVKQGDEITNELILFAADSNTIKDHIETLEIAGLRPVAIDILPCALFRSFERSMRRQEDKERAAVFVDVGSRFTTVVFDREGEISFVKQIPIGGESFNREIASKLGVDINEAEVLRDKLRMIRTTGSGGAQNMTDTDALDASTQQMMIDAIGRVSEDLAREVSLCFRYYTVTFRGKRVERAIFAGGYANESVLLNVLRRQLAVEIEIAQPLRGFDMPQNAVINFDSYEQSPLCEWAVAVGLGLKNWNKFR
jgi:type IV pilus assembly protein PilM